MSARDTSVFAVASALALVAGLATAQSDFIDLRRVGPVLGNAEAVREKSAACAGCHGRDGIGVADLFPSIAGQPAEYLYGRLQAYRPADPPQQPMTAMTREMSDQDMRDYATLYAAMSAPQSGKSDKHANDRQQDERAAGLYRRGDASAGIPPCQGCHGVDGQGLPADTAGSQNRLYPHLRGQHAAYLRSRLAEFRDGRNIHTSSATIMQGVARNLGQADADAMANWLQDAP